MPEGDDSMRLAKALGLLLCFTLASCQGWGGSGHFVNDGHDQGGGGDDDGNNGGGAQQEISVSLNCYPAPFAVGTRMTFDASNAWSNNPPISFDWDFDGDGNWDVSGGTSKTEDYTPDTEGTFTARVRVTDAQSRSAEATKQYRVEPEGAAGGSYDPEGPPVAQLGAWPTIGNAPLEVHLDGKGCWAKDGKKLIKYEYDLDGDGGFETSKPGPDEFLHTFTEAGEYNISIRCTAGNGKTATDSKSITVNPAPPGGGGGNGGGDGGSEIPEFHFDPIAVVIASDVLINRGETVEFDGSSSIDPLGTIVNYEWDFDGDGTFETSGPAVTSGSHTFTETGIFIVTLQVTDDAGNVAQYQSYIIVLESGAP